MRNRKKGRKEEERLVSKESSMSVQ